MDGEEKEDFDPEALYRSGDHPTMWKIRYSEDRCIAMFPGNGHALQVRHFCPRIGGRIPRVDQESNFDRMREVSSGMWRTSSFDCFVFGDASLTC